ncbi:MAG: bifunctional riboflavin kinase/FAD synthetase [Planctomycetes bacterium]|nr:bifunctional riboflavin kinase/FAD synthetase [Planctomycetota bacterium]
MIILRGLESTPDPRLAGSVVTWGVFDGVHRGHRQVLATLTSWARERGAPAVVVTFDRHPAEVLRGIEVPLVCPLEERLDLIGGCGVDVTLVLSFTKAFAQNTAEGFVAEIIVGRVRAKAILLGHDSHFGKDRAGDYDFLKGIGERLGVEVRACEPLLHRGRPMSSSLVREAVAAGRLDEASELLGRPFSLHGVVVAGDGRGRSIGVPTANLELRHKVRPPGGVYAVWVLTGGGTWPGVANIGTRPTFIAGGSENVEVHLLDYSGEALYGRELEVRFVARLRDERKFAGVEDLRRQIREDIAAARALLR